MLFKVEARVTLKHGVLDAPGQVLETSLRKLGFEAARNVRVGKFIALDVEGADADAVRAQVCEMGARLLANPVVEDFHFDMVPAAR